MNTTDIKSFSSWEEKIYIETNEHVFIGLICVPTTSNREHCISEFLDSNKKFISLKNCKMKYKNDKSENGFKNVNSIQINTDSIIFIKHIKN